MIRTALLCTLFALPIAAAPAAAAELPRESAELGTSRPVQIAKAGKKKKGEKPAEKAVERPAEVPRDPRANEPAPADTGGGGAEAGMIGEVRRGMSRIEFDDRLIQGQTNKANAIYLFERRESALRSLLRKRTHFHEEIDETLQ